jgi:hypothetical protein
MEMKAGWEYTIILIERKERNPRRKRKEKQHILPNLPDLPQNHQTNIIEKKSKSHRKFSQIGVNRVNWVRKESKKKQGGSLQKMEEKREKQ